MNERSVNTDEDLKSVSIFCEIAILDMVGLNEWNHELFVEMIVK